jgi:hypothetical protein
MDCPYLAPCPFFNDRMAKMPATADVFKASYCRRSYTDCARFRVAEKLGKEKVPADLFPNQTERGAELVAGK